MRLAIVLAILTHLSAVSALAQTATFARTDYPFLRNDHIVVDVNRDDRMDLVGNGRSIAVKVAVLTGGESFVRDVTSVRWSVTRVNSTAKRVSPAGWLCHVSTRRAGRSMTRYLSTWTISS